jgi:hypothetical protein
MPMSVPVGGGWPAAVRTPRTDEFRVVMPDGLIVEGLPIGTARGHWRIAFVCSGVDFQ